MYKQIRVTFSSYISQVKQIRFCLYGKLFYPTTANFQSFEKEVFTTIQIILLSCQTYIDICISMHILEIQLTE